MVGRNIAEALLPRDHVEVIGPTRAELDLEARGAVREYLAAAKPDVVIHAAGKVGGIRANMAEPTDFLAVNLRIGTNVIDEARQVGVGRLINIASSCMYPRQASNPLREDSILTGELEPTNEGYALAKIASTRLCEYISREHEGLHYKTLIPCNLYGRYDHFDSEKGHMIAAVMRRMHAAAASGAKTMTIWGDGTARREFMYVGDLADFVAQHIERIDELTDVMNVGLGQDYSVREYYDAIRRVTGYEGEFEHDLSKPVGMKQKLVDVSRQRALGWMPSTSLEDGLRKTYDYFLTGEQK